MTPTVQALLLQALRRFRDRPCLRWEGGGIATYAQTSERVAALAHWMQRETAPGSGIAILLDNSREYLETILACALAGRVRVPLNTREAPAVSAHKIEQVQASVLVTSSLYWTQVCEHLARRPQHSVLVDDADGYASLVAKGASTTGLEPAAAGDLYRLSFTGGTTGRPKAVMQTHRQELAMMRNLLLEVVRPSIDSTFVAATPLSHASGAFVVPSILAGGSLSWTGRFEAQRLVDSSWLEGAPGVETFLVPTALADVADAAAPQHSLVTVVYGGAPCPLNTLELAVERLGLCLVQVYGQAEAPMTICVLDRESHADLAVIEGSPGHPFTFVDVRIERDRVRVPDGEVGEVVVYAEHTMEGYLGAEEETAERLGADRSIRTQDRGYFDQAGRLRLVGRDRELIITGGFNVFPDEVERRLGNPPGVRERTVFGLPDERWGESVMLAVVPERGADLDEQAVLGWVKERASEALASYETPKRVVFVDALPRTSVGKISRADLADLFSLPGD